MLSGLHNLLLNMGTAIALGALGFLYLMGFCLMAINPRDDE